MKNLERDVANHYGDADLLNRIFAGLDTIGADLGHLKPDDLAPVEEFHIGGRKATAYAVDKMSLNQNQRVLDVGCGIGGTSRYIALQTGCQVNGIDLTPEYIESARALTKLTRLDKQITFDVASALNMPFDNQSFDAVITIHVAMNIAERAALYGEIARVMKPGATLCIFDVMKNTDDSLVFPVPWAESPETSFLTTADEMSVLLKEAGFEVREIEDRSQFAFDFFKENMTTATNQPPALGIHLVMGKSADVKLKNVFHNLENGRISPVLMIATRV